MSEIEKMKKDIELHFGKIPKRQEEYMKKMIRQLRLYQASEKGDLLECEIQIDQGKDVNFLCKQETPLYAACEKGNLDVVDLLLENEACVDQKCIKGQTALHAAARQENIEICQMLIQKGANVDQINSQGETPLCVATVAGKKDACKMLLQKKAKITVQLHRAVYYNRIEICSLLLENGADIDNQCSKGKTPLHVAASRGNKEMCEWLIQKGADLNKKDKQGKTALVIVKEKDCIDICQLIIEKRKQNRKDKKEKEKEEICQICLENVKNSEYQCSKCKKKYHGHCIEQQMEYNRKCPNCRQMI